jgi:cytochrome P450
MELFTDEIRRRPFALYDQLRRKSPLLYDSSSGLWMIFDYDGVKRVLEDHDAFSSRNGPEWLIFTDPPQHSKLRGLISQAFTPRSIIDLEPRIEQLTRELLNRSLGAAEMDLAADFSIPLPITVIAEMVGVPIEDRARFNAWNDVLLRMSQVVVGQPSGAILNEYMAATREMGIYIAALAEERRKAPKDDLLSRLVHAQVDGSQLNDQEILGFFQLLLLAGSETTTNLINNAVLCFADHADELAQLRTRPDLLPSAIEEVLRYRSPLQWMYRVARRDVEMHGQTIPAGKLVLAWIGSANHDPTHFHEPEHFDISRNPNPHLAFGHGVHFCLGASLSRLEGRIAIRHLLQAMTSFEVIGGPNWEPRQGLHVHGPSRLPIRFKTNNSGTVAF